ncbi:glycosyltransferase [Salegentibacter sp. F188]|uniref:Glycosyltransferase n=1 Tax=Autumnicola patrickiae TaxID=3075591 RepID=A0ABU3E2D9_9FLAO|nr:glycosyltransferase [Salegentibacter sp. F188]MDT0690121.1 glycosyltransferase [Salegentibacter sp. F188]
MKNLLVIGYVWPEPDSSAAGSRMMQLLEFFLAENYEITFASTAHKTPFMADLKELDILTEEIAVNDPDFDRFLYKLNPEIVLFDRFMIEEQFGWRVEKICPDAIKILDTEDLHFLRNARMEAQKWQLSAKSIYMDSDLTKREIAAIYRSDLSLIISEVELKILQSDFRISKNILLYLPFMLNPVSEEEIQQSPSFNNRSHFISIGTFKHKPNWNAVLQLKQHIWPLIRKELPEARIYIYGSYPTKKVHDLNSPETGFLVKGRADSAHEVMKKARVCLAPLQFGAGLKGKFIDAMRCGTPSVTTRIGAEGISDGNIWGGFIENNNEAFAEKAVELYRNREVWEKAQSDGFSIINSRFPKEIFEQIFREKLQKIKKQLIYHRKSNFIGAMLRHHLHKSTFFMSKYIQEKNKKTAD